MKDSRDRSRVRPSAKPRLSDLYCGRIVRYYNTGKSGEKRGGYGWIEKRLCSSELPHNEYPKVWFHIKELKKRLPRLAKALDADPYSLSGKLFWFTVEVQSVNGESREQVASIYADISQIPCRREEIASEIKRRIDSIADVRRKTIFADDVLMLVPELAVEEESLYECLMRHASLDRILSFVKYVSTQTLPASIVENLARYLIRLGHARELWNIGRIPRVFFVQPFIERLSQAEGSEETQWLVERLLEIDSAVVLKDPSVRQLAFQFASSEQLVRCINPIVASEAEVSTIREVLGEWEEYLTQRAPVDRVLDVVRRLSEEGLLTSIVENLARYLIRLGHARELWNIGRIPRVFFVQPFIERLPQAEGSEETQWLVERLLEIDSAVVLKDPSVRQLAFQFANSNRLLECINQFVVSTAETLTIHKVLGELEHYLLQQFGGRLENAWKLLANIEKFIEHRGLLWQVATEQLKFKTLKKCYQRFFEVLEACENLQYNEELVYQSAARIANQFTEEDKQWVYQFIPTPAIESEQSEASEQESSELKEKLWEYKVHDILCYSVNDRDFLRKYRKYYVARAAEKAAINYYCGIGYEVEDISILPVKLQSEAATVEGTQSDDRWRYADIVLRKPHETIYVDVKSSTIEDRMYYRSTFVKSFKIVGDREVIYTGVIYNFDVFRRVHSDINKHTIVTIGEAQTSIISSLKEFCEHNGVTFALPKGREEGNQLPIYLFDYGQDFYRDKVSLISEIATLQDSEIPDWEDAKLISKYYKTNLIAVFLMGKRRPPDDWIMNMSEWQKRFVEIINSIPENIRLVSLPFLFFAILIHFIECINNEDIAKDYHPKRLSHSFLRVGKYTIGILDPFSVIESFINMILVPLWEKRSQIQRFKQFRLIGPQLLQAAHSSSRETSQWITLVAWCENCGYFPLVFGVNPTCTACGRLICANRLRQREETCYTCSKNCGFNRLSPEKREPSPHYRSVP